MQEIMFKRRFLAAMILLAASLGSLPSAAQSTDPSRTFSRRPLSVTIFDGTGLANNQRVVAFPIGAGQAVDLMTVPVDVRVPPRHRAFLTVQFVGHFILPRIPVTMTLDCAVDGVLRLEFGCGITPATDLDFTSFPGTAGAPHAIVPATFIIRDVPRGVHQIGVRTEAATSLGSVHTGGLFTNSSSLIVSLYAEKED